VRASKSPCTPDKARLDQKRGEGAAKAKACTIPWTSQSTSQFRRQEKTSVYLIDEGHYISFFDGQFIIILCLIWKYYLAVILSCKKKTKYNL
jgi:hypothetical protein